jgi:hypothetical protein
MISSLAGISSWSSNIKYNYPQLLDIAAQTTEEKSRDGNLASVFTSWAVNEGEIATTVQNGSFTINPVTALLYLPLDAVGSTGSTVQVPVSVFPGDAICGLDLTIQYDPSVIQAENVAV